MGANPAAISAIVEPAANAIATLLMWDEERDVAGR